jgi:signal transduction histidine kinase
MGRYNNVSSILEDDLGNLWFGDFLGLYQINKGRSNAILFNNDNNIATDENRNLSIYKGIDGKLYFNSENGYHIIDPIRLEFDTTTISLLLTDFWINQDKISFLGDQSLQQPLSQITEIRLKNRENVFGFSISAPDFHTSIGKTIFYRLDGYDIEWKSSLSQERINYYKIPAGKYMLRVKAANGLNGLWTEEKIEIFIAKPWWQQWWAYLTYLIGLIFGIGLVLIYLRERVIRIERQKAQEKELEQAREIEKTYTELKNTQDQLIQSEKMASLGQLTAGIAHEIKNPLNFVNNFSELNAELIDELQEKAGQGNIAEVKEIAENIKSNELKIIEHGNRADSIVKGMLLHSRGAKGERNLTDINALVEEYSRLAYHGLRARDNSFNVALQFHFDEDLEKIDIVSQDIGRVFLNIITNAFQACSERSRSAMEAKKKGSSGPYEPKVLVTTSKGNGQILISVKDNGTGIPEEYLKKIFQPFFTTKPTGKGTGLGLSISYDIVKAHGGEIKVTSQEGEGSEFIVKIPI